MLERSVEKIIENIRNFIVACDEDKLVGCCALSFFTEELAEIRSLAVCDTYRKKGTGSLLVKKAEDICRDEGVKFIFALTLSKDFFIRLGYKVVNKDIFPQKIWRDCTNCPKIMACDEIAVRKTL
jgi:amino-acid N-acetyltransferase